MKTSNFALTRYTILLCAALSLPAPAQNKDDAPKAAPASSDAEMTAQMLALAKPGPNHKILAACVGTWSYHVKMWMSPDPNAPASESDGVAVIKPILGGRFFQGTHDGKMRMPGPDGKMTEMEFHGVGTDGYDNVKKKFVSSWVDDMGTGIMQSEGDYDAAAKTLTYFAEMEAIPGMKSKMREVIKFIDNDHHTLEFYEVRGGTEVKTMELSYARKS